MRLRKNDKARMLLACAAALFVLLAGPISADPAVSFVMPKETDYTAAFLRVVHDTPAMTDNEETLRQWAVLRFPQEYDQVAHQEFKLRPLLDRAKADLTATLTRTDTSHMAVSFPVQFGSYDFDKQRFPILRPDGALRLMRPCCTNWLSVPNLFALTITNPDALAGLPMPPNDAEAFVKRRTRGTFVDRELYAIATVKIDPAGFKLSSWGYHEGNIQVESAAIFPDKRALQPIAVLTSKAGQPK